MKSLHLNLQRNICLIIASISCSAWHILNNKFNWLRSLLNLNSKDGQRQSNFTLCHPEKSLTAIFLQLSDLTRINDIITISSTQHTSTGNANRLCQLWEEDEEALHQSQWSQWSVEEQDRAPPLLTPISPSSILHSASHSYIEPLC